MGIQRQEPPSILTRTPNNQPQPLMRPSLPRSLRRFFGCRYQHRARVILPGLRWVCWIQTFFDLTRMCKRQTGHTIPPFNTRFKRRFFAFRYLHRERVILGP